MSPETPSSNPDIDFILAQLDIVNTTITSKETNNKNNGILEMSPIIKQKIHTESDIDITELLKKRLSEAGSDEIHEIRVFLEALGKANMA